MALTRRGTMTPSGPAWSAWPGRRLQDWIERRGSSPLQWPDWPEWWPGIEAPDLRVEEYQEGNELVVRAEMPGIDPDNDVEITITDHMLRLRAERRQEKRTEGKAGFRSEFSYGAFTRSVPLPTSATESDVKASYVDGILEVRIPFDSAEAESRRIPVNRG
jgi:HSP20 family protein